ncbi:MAG TPA: TldD/PmbA family protein [Pseudomonadales bacterium]|nr:TldD/PmbA family protein [Pseudomonadales bacterium]
MSSNQLTAPSGAAYSETRQHEVRRNQLVMIDGSLATNSETSEGGTSARVWNSGYWGFASVPATDSASAAKVAKKATDNAAVMGRFGEQPKIDMPLDAHVGEYGYNGRPPMSRKEVIELLEALNAHCKKQFPDVKSATFMLQEESHAKRFATSNGSSGLSSINRAAAYLVLTADDKNGNPVQLMQTFSGKGNFADLGLSFDKLIPELAELHRHLQAKRVAVAPRGGKHTVVISPELAGMLAHEAMGHPCEADIVLGGAVTGNLVDQQVASELITMVDFANTYGSQELMIPVYVDDEGTEARDAVLIEKGILKHFMTSRETAAKLGIASTGNARAYTFNDEPLVRMRNTAILPGSRKIEDIISEVDDGYYLMKTGNGQADSTSEFMFGITLAYEIKNGKLGNAITDTTVSGRAIDMLKTVDAVSDDMYWECNGYCGKKQPMIVSLGGPALRARAHLGGQ